MPDGQDEDTLRKRYKLRVVHGGFTTLATAKEWVKSKPDLLELQCVPEAFDEGDTPAPFVWFTDEMIAEATT
jgi:hypothetical protein